MPHRLLPWLAAVLTLALAPAARADEPGNDAKDIAIKITSAGAALFDARDAKGLAATYAEESRIDIISKDNDTGSLKIESSQGRTEIEAYYKKLFEGSQRIHARNTVEYARLAGPSLLVISGVFVPDTEADEPLKLPFTQVRIKQDGAWRIVRLQVVVPSRN
jgi:hypothetical protein